MIKNKIKGQISYQTRPNSVIKFSIIINVIQAHGTCKKVQLCLLTCYQQVIVELVLT